MYVYDLIYAAEIALRNINKLPLQVEFAQKVAAKSSSYFQIYKYTH